VDSAKPEACLKERVSRQNAGNATHLTATQVGLVIIIALGFACIGLMTVLLTAVSGTRGSRGRALADGLLSWGTFGFVVGCPLACVVIWRVLGRIRDRYGLNQRTYSLLLFASWILIGTLGAFLAWGWAALLALHFAWGALVPLGMGLITHGLTRRVGVELHCARCGYAHDDELEVCPECGADWNGRGSLLEGRLERSRAMVSVGIAVLVLALVLTIRPLVVHVVSPLVPTRVLIAQVGSGATYSPDVWNELSSRSLTPEQEQRLADALLDRRLHVGSLDLASNAWLEQRVAKGQIRVESIERYFREMVELDLRGAAKARVGETIRIEALVENRTTPWSGVGVRIFFAGFSVDGEPVPGTRMEQRASVYVFDEWSVKRKPGAELPAVEVQATRPGVIAVEAEAWLIFAPEAALGWGRAWDEDGRPIIPPGVLWTEPVKLRHEIVVE